MGFGFFEGSRGIYLWISKDMIDVLFFQKLAQGLMGHSLFLRCMVNLTIKKDTHMAIGARCCPNRCCHLGLADCEQQVTIL